MLFRRILISMISGTPRTTSPRPGASTRELIGSLGHASMRAALIYQHRTITRDRAIPEALDALIEHGPS